MRLFAFIGLLVCVVGAAFMLMYWGWSLAGHDLRQHHRADCARVIDE